MRLTALARTDRWRGGVQRLPDAELVSGAIEARAEGFRLTYGDGHFDLTVRSPRLDIEADLRLTPVCTPAPIHNATVGDGPPIHWVVIPRLVASGEVRTAGRRWWLDRVPAYHDHNWGYFGWGRDFAWEWGFGLPRDLDQPWSMVFARLSNRHLNRNRMQTLFIWHGDKLAAALRDSQIEIRHEGLLRPSRILKVPPVMGLVSRGRATDVPARVDIRADSPHARLEAVFLPEDVAQVIIPNDDDLGVTIINEVAGSLRVRLRVGERHGEIDCRTIFEFLGR